MTHPIYIKSENMETELQKTITKDHLIQICKLMHHSLTDEQLSKLEYHFKYTWVVVSFRVKGYGYISFGIDNHSQSQLFGNEITTYDIKQAIDKGIIDLTIWRFADDEIYKREQQAKEFLKKNYSKPSVIEFYNIYYQD